MESRPHTVPAAVALLSGTDTEELPYNHLHWQENGLEDLLGLSGSHFFVI